MSNDDLNRSPGAIRAFLKRQPRLQIILIALVFYGLLFAMMIVVAIGFAWNLSA